MESLTFGLRRIDRCKTSGWGHRYCRRQWLETLGDTAQN